MQTLFSQWGEEDAKMAEQEREAEDRIWENLEETLAENIRALQFRQLS